MAREGLARATDAVRPAPVKAIGRWLALLGLTVALLLPLTRSRPAEAASQVRYARFDVTLDVRQDGSYHVTETQVVTFNGGSFRLGHRSIPTERIEQIANIRVSETTDAGPRPYQQVDLTDLPNQTERFSTLGTATAGAIYWHFAPTSVGTRTFVVEYDVLGALRVYRRDTPPNEQVWWSAFGSELTNETPVDAASLTIRLPRPIADLSQVSFGPRDKTDPRQRTADGRVFTWRHGPFDAGDAFEARLVFPPIIEADPPAWQANDDAQRARAESRARRHAAVNLTLLAVGLALAAGGGLGVFGLWYARGRDPHAGLVADFLPQPPDDLPPGAAGALVDERADERDVVATFLDLGRKGALTMKEERTPGLLGVGAGLDYTLTIAGVTPTLTAFERKLLRSLFGEPRPGQTVRLSEVKGRFRDAEPAIKDGLYAELVRRGYFTRSPEETRARWRRAGMVALALAGVLGLGAIVALGLVALFPALVAAALALILLRLSRAMPRRTRAGAEACAKWNAFRRYLTSIERYDRVSDATAIFDRYLPYAVAFGLETSWVGKFAAVDTTQPAWYGAGAGGWTPSGRRSGGDGWLPGGSIALPSGGSGAGSDLHLPDVELPSLQGASNRASRATQSSSDSLLSMIGLVFDVLGAFSGGSRGGSSGGGGGGFS